MRGFFYFFENPTISGTPAGLFHASFSESTPADCVYTQEVISRQSVTCLIAGWGSGDNPRAGSAAPQDPDDDSSRCVRLYPRSVFPVLQMGRYRVVRSIVELCINFPHFFLNTSSSLHVLGRYSEILVSDNIFLNRSFWFSVTDRSFNLSLRTISGENVSCGVFEKTYGIHSKLT